MNTTKPWHQSISTTIYRLLVVNSNTNGWFSAAAVHLLLHFLLLHILRLHGVQHTWDGHYLSISQLHHRQLQLSITNPISMHCLLELHLSISVSGGLVAGVHGWAAASSSSRSSRSPAGPCPTPPDRRRRGDRWTASGVPRGCSSAAEDGHLGGPWDEAVHLVGAGPLLALDQPGHLEAVVDVVQDVHEAALEQQPEEQAGGVGPPQRAGDGQPINDD